MNKRVVCIGGALVDELFYANEPMMANTTNMVALEQSAGGVARNLAHQLAVLGIPVSLVGAFGDDASGQWLMQQCMAAGIDISASVFAKNASTGKYTGIINPDGSLFTALLSNHCNHLITPQHLGLQEPKLLTASFIVADTNLTVASLQWLTDFTRRTAIPLIIEPVSVPPAKKLQQVDLNGVFLITPNKDELPVISKSTYASMEENIAALLHAGIQNIWLHNGEEGSLFYNKQTSFAIEAKPVTVVDSTGAGDGTLAGFIFAQCMGRNFMESVEAGHRLAEEILQLKGAIAPHANPTQILNTELKDE